MKAIKYIAQFVLLAVLASIVAAVVLIMVVNAVSTRGQPLEFEHPLPGGYCVVGSDSKTVVAETPEHFYKHDTNAWRGVAVGPKVTGIALCGNIIVGYAESSPQSAFAHADRPGYFIIDSTTGFVERGLQEPAWTERLHQLGVTVLPELESP